MSPIVFRPLLMDEMNLRTNDICVAGCGCCLNVGPESVRGKGPGTQEGLNRRPVLLEVHRAAVERLPAHLTEAGGFRERDMEAVSDFRRWVGPVAVTSFSPSALINRRVQSAERLEAKEEGTKRRQVWILASIVAVRLPIQRAMSQCFAFPSLPPRESLRCRTHFIGNLVPVSVQFSELWTWPHQEGLEVSVEGRSWL